MVIISSKKLCLMDLCLLFYPLLLGGELLFLQNTEMQLNPILFFILYFSGAIIGGLPSVFYYLYKKIKSKSHNTSKSLKKKRSYFRLVKGIHRHNQKLISFLIIFCLALINGIYLFVNTITYKNLELRVFFFLMLFNTFFTGLFCYCILKQALYRHHYLGLGILLVGILFINGSFFGQLGKEIWLLIGISLGLSILLALVSVESKKIMEEKYIHPIMFQIIYGIFGMVIVGIFTSILVIFFQDNEFSYVANFSIHFLNIFKTWTNILALCGYILLRICLSSMFFGIIYYWNPLEETILRHFTGFYETIFTCISTSFVESKILFLSLVIVGCILSLLGFFIYFELLVLHCFSLEEYTKKILQKRGKEEACVGELSEFEEIDQTIVEQLENEEEIDNDI